MSNQANIKAITRHMVDRVGGYQATSDICGVAKSDISHWCNDHHARFIPIDHLIDLDAAAGDLFLKEWARTRGYEITPVEKQIEAKPCVTSALGLLSKEAGELSFTVLEAFADHLFTPTEKRRIRDDIAPVKDAIAQLERAIA
jgi:hypothetical protein